MRPTRVALALGAAAAVASTLGAAPGSAAAVSSFTAVAGADIVSVVVNTEPNLVVPNIVDVGAFTAQAELTSLGDSTAFSATPFPGEIVTVAPGLASGVLALPVELPSYPLLVSSSHPATPDAEASAGTLSLRASSRADESHATGSDGASSSEASVSVDRQANIVTASAESTVSGFQLGGLLTLDGVRSMAAVTRTADGQLERQSDFSIVGFTVLGQQLRLADDGLELPESSLPVNVGGALDPLAGVLDSLEQQGVSIRVLDAIETEEGVMSAGLEVSRRFDTGVNGLIASVTVTFGRQVATISGNASRIPTLPTPSGSAAAGGGAALPSNPGSSSSGGGAFSQPNSVASPGVPASVNAEPTAAATEPVSSIVPEIADGARFYPVLIVAGAAMHLLMNVFRKRGVKLTWLS